MRATATPDQKNNRAALRVAEQLILRRDAKLVEVIKPGRRRFVTAVMDGVGTKLLVKSRYSGDWQLSINEHPGGADFFVLVDECQKGPRLYHMFAAGAMCRWMAESYATWLADEDLARGKRAGHRVENDDAKHTRITDKMLAEWLQLPWARDSWSEQE